MVRSFAAVTREVDNAEAAVSEILGQLNLDGGGLLKNTVGIASCYAEYVESGVWKALCEALPFEVIGSTTIANASAGETGETMFCLLVLTSDDLRFSTGLSIPITGEDIDALEAMYRQAADKLPGESSLMLSYVPLLNHLSPEFYVESMSEVSGGVPNFGTLAVDHNSDYHDSRVLLNGESWTDRAAVLLIGGPASPAFFVGTISSKKIFSEKNLVTAAERNRLWEVNGTPVIEFLQSIGLSRNEDGTITGLNSFPVVLDYNDGTPPAIRTMYALSPEGYIVCGGTFPVGSSLSLGTFDAEEIVSTTRQTLNQAMETRKYSVFLVYSCIGRYFAQGYNNTVEFDAVMDSFGRSGTAYMAAYSGGEICPVYGQNGQIHNRSHGNSFIICAL